MGSNVEQLLINFFNNQRIEIAPFSEMYNRYIQEGDRGMVQGDDRKNQGAQATHCLLQWQGNLRKLPWRQM